MCRPCVLHVARAVPRALADRIPLASGELSIQHYSTQRREMIYKVMGFELPGAGLVHQFLQWRSGSAAPLTTDSGASYDR